MKHFACLFSLYLLLLSIVPCVDAAKENTLSKTETSQNTTASHPNDIDECSPFCTCNCCVSPVVFQNYSMEFDCFYFIKDCPSEYTFNDLSLTGTSIWQPPQLS
jgi:hypothetical protein